MKQLMTAAFALALLSGTSALAQPDPNDHRDHGGSGGQAAPHGQGGGQPAPRPNVAAPARPAPSAAQGGYQGARPSGGYQGAPGGTPRGGYPAYQGSARPTGPTAGYNGGYQGGARGGTNAAAAPGGAHAGVQGGARGVPNTYHPAFGAPGFRPGPGAARPHYDAQYFPRVFQPAHQYAWRAGYWRPQPGFYYRHWGYGERLPFGWFAAQWYINDYYDYDLPVPPYGYEWVRTGPDALLVDLDDGTVVESVYGLFY